jgi:hypothetical protein
MDELVKKESGRRAAIEAAEKRKRKKKKEKRKGPVHDS